jgi:hypothetical protein
MHPRRVVPPSLMAISHLLLDWLSPSLAFVGKDSLESLRDANKDVSQPSRSMGLPELA